MTIPDTYDYGTVSVESGDAVVTGSGTLWTLVRKFDKIALNDTSLHSIVEVTDDTHLVIEPPWAGDALSGASYVITYDSNFRNANGQLAVDTSRLRAAIEGDGYFIYVKPAATEPDPSKGNDGQYARQPSSGKEWLKVGGVWSFQGTYGAFSFDPTQWDSATTYARSVIVPRGGKLWYSLQANNLNHVPESSPEWWEQFLAGGDAYDIANFDTDRPASGEDVLEFVFTKNVTFFAGMTDSKARAKVGATSQAAYSLKKNGSEFATITFAASGQGGPQTATFACASDTTFAPGDYLSITAPAVRDETLSGIAWTISAYRT